MGTGESQHLAQYFQGMAENVEGWCQAGFHPGRGGGGGGDPDPPKIYGGDIPPLIFTNTFQSTCSYE